DELFGGYTTFTKVPRLLKYGAGLRSAARLLANLKTANPIQWQKVADAGPLQNLAEAYLLQRSIRWRLADSGGRGRRIQGSLQKDSESLANDFQEVAAMELQFYSRNQ